MTESYENLTDFLREHEIRHFTGPEIARVKVPPLHLWAKIIPTLQVAERLRASLNEEKSGAYIWVTSAYRDPAHNLRVGGAANSLHVRFNALDIIPMRGQERISLDVCRNYLREDSLYHFIGLGKYETFLHIDTRGVFTSYARGVEFK